jgi:hypothetical protein
VYILHIDMTENSFRRSWTWYNALTVSFAHVHKKLDPQIPRVLLHFCRDGDQASISSTFAHSNPMPLSLPPTQDQQSGQRLCPAGIGFLFKILVLSSSRGSTKLDEAGRGPVSRRERIVNAQSVTRRTDVGMSHCQITAVHFLAQT